LKNKKDKKMKLKLMMVLGLMAVLSAKAERLFFTFDNGLTDVKNVEEQAKLLKELGYAGICTRPKNCTDELLAAFDKLSAHTKVRTTYPFSLLSISMPAI